MQNQQVVDYIKQRLQRGDVELDIRRELERVGWQAAIIDQAWSDAASSPVVSMHEQPTTKQSATMSQSAHKKPSGKRLYVVAVLLFVTIVSAVYLLHQVRPPKVAYSGNTGSTSNNIRQDDASLIAEAISNFIGSNGKLPQSTGVGKAADMLNVCGKTCDPNTQETTRLYFYKPGLVTYHLYASDLKVPDVNTVYILNNANCNGNSGIGSHITEQDAVVILYAFATDAGAQQKCLSLQGNNPISP
jgi:hypothetical protein